MDNKQSYADELVDRFASAGEGSLTTDDFIEALHSGVLDGKIGLADFEQALLDVFDIVRHVALSEAANVVAELSPFAAQEDAADDACCGCSDNDGCSGCCK